MMLRRRMSSSVSTMPRKGGQPVGVQRGVVFVQRAHILAVGQADLPMADTPMPIRSWSAWVE